jgi:hypothetical protein
MTTPADTPPTGTTPPSDTAPPSAAALPRDDTPPLAAVLLACTRDPGDARTPAALRAALARVASAPAGEPGWDALAAAAARHGLGGLLYRRIVDLAYEAVPQAVLLGWRERTVAVAQRSLRMQVHLLRVLDALHEAGVAALAYKGPALSQQLYGDAGLRHFSDLDLLVDPASAARARDVALAAGFTERYAFDAVPLSLLQDAEQEIGFTHPETGLQLDVHWRVGPRFAADSLLAEELFARAATVKLLDREVQTLGAHDVVLTLTIHASVHGWLKLEDVAAVAAALRRLTPAEAATLPALALEHGCQRRLHVGVLLAATLAEEELPALLTRPAHDDRRAKDIASRAGARLVWSVTAPEVLDTSDPRARAKGVLWEAVGLDTGPAAAKHLWRRLTTAGARDWREAPLPDAPAGPTAAEEALGGASMGVEEAEPQRAPRGAEAARPVPDPSAAAGPAQSTTRRPLARLRTFIRRQRRIWRPPGAGGH